MLIISIEHIAEVLELEYDTIQKSLVFKDSEVASF